MRAFKTVAIIGASSNRAKFGNKSVRAHQAEGYSVFPINPQGGMIEGTQAYTSMAELPDVEIDRVSMYVPPGVGLKMLAGIAEKGCEQLWLNPGTSSEELVAEARRLGLNPIQGCSIVDIGRSPSEFE